jgi:hypothetical protein
MYSDGKMLPPPSTDPDITPDLGRGPRPPARARGSQSRRPLETATPLLPRRSLRVLPFKSFVDLLASARASERGHDGEVDSTAIAVEEMRAVPPVIDSDLGGQRNWLRVLLVHFMEGRAQIRTPGSSSLVQRLNAAQQKCWHRYQGKSLKRSTFVQQ